MSSEILDSYGRVKIVRDNLGEIPKYIILPPMLSEGEKRIVENPTDIIADFKYVMQKIGELSTSSEKEAYIRNYILEALATRDVSVENRDYLATLIIDELFLGYGIIGDLIRDDDLEEIMVNGVSTPIFVVHRKHGMCSTNLEYTDHKSLDKIINWMSNYAGRVVSEERPLFDAHLPDGSRVNVAVPPVAPHGPSITIRKFKKVPYNVIDLINLGSISTDLAAFLWVCVEGLGLKPCDLLIAGGAGSGKTTLLNALSMFLPRTERIVTVEDTLELNFDFIDNVVALEATPYAFGEENVLDMHTLVKNSLRMRPDRVIVGEVRGSEAETLLVAMDIGLDGSMGTIHANNARETTIRLMEQPMNVPIRMIPLIDLIIVVNRIFDRTRGMTRRVTQVAEVSGVEKDVVQLGDIFKWDVETDQITRTMYPIILKEKIAQGTGITKKRLNTEIYIRERILKYMVDCDIRDNKEVIELFQRYHMNPKEVIAEIKEKKGLIAEE
ncbi:MAG: ATPase, T2SS/T4P/T4SS family [Candidatus Altiarchaeota archaeon]